MISRFITKAAVVGVAASLAVAAPAAAATTPTLDPAPLTIGFNDVTLTGTAAPGAKVQLYETAYIWPDTMAPAKDYSNNNGPVTTTANSAGKFTFSRTMDSGHWFMVIAEDDVNNKSNTIAAAVQQLPFFAQSGLLASPSANTVTATIVASPGQTDLKAELQRQAANGTWVKIAEGDTAGEQASVALTATGVPAGPGSFRAYVHGDDKNNVKPGPGAVRQLTVLGTVTNPPTTPPTTKPPTTPPTTPPATIPAAGAVQFTRIQYDSPGVDSGSNGSLNTEWAKLTNKTKATINLKGWSVRDYAGTTYRFASNYNLGAGQSLFLLTGKGTNIVGKRFWNRSGKLGYIWNNASEIAYLSHSSGKLIDTCMWKTVGPGYTNC